MRRLSLGLAAFVISAVLSGCGGGAAETKTELPKDPNEGKAAAEKLKQMAPPPPPAKPG